VNDKLTDEQEDNFDCLKRCYTISTDICDPIDFIRRHQGLLYAISEFIISMYKPQENEDMDKQIRKIEKKEKAVAKDLKHLEKADKKRDKLVDMGKKAKKNMKSC